MSLWDECGTCKQRYFGATKIGLARARWERARGLPEEDDERLAAMNSLANALQDARDYAAALPLYEDMAPWNIVFLGVRAYYARGSCV